MAKIDKIRKRTAEQKCGFLKFVGVDAHIDPRYSTDVNKYQ